MNKSIKLLDCTLRDGGYVNNWKFGHDTARFIFEQLCSADIDIVEIGFLNDKYSNCVENTIQNNTLGFDTMFKNCDKKDTLVFAMIDYGTCSIDNIAPKSESIIDGIRLIFKKPNMFKAIEFGKILAEKGYLVSYQLVSITDYFDRDILDFCDEINKINPFCVSIVDTYGLMHKEKMLSYYYLLDHNLNKDITIGYHSHNNFQLGYANSLEFLNRNTTRNLLVDGTVYGMGKGAGNAPLELITMYLNENYDKRYNINNILEIIDVCLVNIYNRTPWGYNYLYYLNASNACHPKYVNYLTNKKTLSIKSINIILQQIPFQDKLLYKENIIEKLYLDYQKSQSKDYARNKDHNILDNTTDVLLLGPGKNLMKQSNNINEYIKINNPYVISLNCIPTDRKSVV